MDGVFTQDFSNMLYGWAQDLLTWIGSQVILNIDTDTLKPLKDYFYGQALGLAQFMVIVIAAVIVPLSLMVMKIKTFAETLKVSAVILLVGPYFFAFCDGVSDMSATFSEALIFYEPPAGREGLVAMPTQGSLSIPGFIMVSASILVFGVVLLVVMVMCLIASYIFRFMGLPMYSLRPLGPKPQHWSDVMISIGIVTLVTAKPTVAFVFSLCKWAGDQLAALSSVFSAVIFAITPLIAVIAVVGLFFVTKHIVSKISEGIRSWVHGAVQTSPKDRQPVSVESINSSYSNTVKASPGQSAITGTPAGDGGAGQSRVLQITQEAGKALLTKVATNVNPVVRGVSMGIQAVGVVKSGVQTTKSALGDVKNGGKLPVPRTKGGVAPK